MRNLLPNCLSLTLFVHDRRHGLALKHISSRLKSKRSDSDYIPNI